MPGNEGERISHLTYIQEDADCLISHSEGNVSGSPL